MNLTKYPEFPENASTKAHEEYERTKGENLLNNLSILPNIGSIHNCSFGKEKQYFQLGFPEMIS